MTGIHHLAQDKAGKSTILITIGQMVNSYLLTDNASNAYIICNFVKIHPLVQKIECRKINSLLGW